MPPQPSPTRRRPFADRTPRPRDWTCLEASVARHAARLAPADRRELEEILRLDLESEYDARFFTAHLEGSGIGLTPAFREMLRRWSEDEERHYLAFARVLRAGFGWGPERFRELEGRRPDFGPLAHLFRDEFTICVLGVYDELATVRAYRANLPHYDRLGPELASLVREVMGDEGWHSSRFLDVLRRHHVHRLHEAPSLVAKIRATEGTPYRQTFVLDHDDAVWSEGLFDEVADMLLRRLHSPWPSPVLNFA